MTDYKELIDTLRDLTHGIVRISNGSVLREAADAIETLTTELAEERHRHDRLQDWDRGMTEKLASAELQCKQINEGAAIVLKKCDAVLEELAQVKAEREAAVETLNALKPFLQSAAQERLMRRIIRQIGTIPAADVEPARHGRWIHTAIEDDNWGGTFHKWTCSNCDFSTGHNPNGTNYCPNCGALMDLEGGGGK